ncbi:phosphatases II [Atractiella rhizophila]|nr:phosphatases II [Atractiella rhizophila]
MATKLLPYTHPVHTQTQVQDPPPPHFSPAIERLCSQYYLSQYSLLKRNNTDQVPAAGAGVTSNHFLVQAAQIQAIQSQQKTSWENEKVAESYRVIPQPPPLIHKAMSDGNIPIIRYPETQETISTAEAILDAVSSPLFTPLSTGIKTSQSHPINMSLIFPPELLSHLHAHLNRPTPPPHPLFMPIYQPTHKSTIPWILNSDLNAFLAATFSPLVSPHPQIGNLLLSSMPGKKVRLTSPTKPSNAQPGSNRRGINRCIRADLMRIKNDAKVELIICCLSDEELSFLGVSWAQYKSTADEFGLRIVRIPMIEGGAPEGQEGIERVDEIVSMVVKDYTLKGKNVLAHCRGGVGRAGLMACCWLAKMGAGYPRERGETCLETVENLIEFVRWRRSVKAIETPNQVEFILRFIEYLRFEGRLVKPHDLRG